MISDSSSRSASSAALRELSISGLRKALEPTTGIYCRQLRDKQWGATSGTEDLTSTAICLIGIARAGVAPDLLGLDPTRSINALVSLALHHQYDGAVGLLVWANAVCEGTSLRDLLTRLDLSVAALAHRAASLTTMEVAWLLSGLAHESTRSSEPALHRALAAVLDELLGRYHRAGKLFRHANRCAPFRHRARRWVANFADQVYPIQALSLGAIATGNDVSIETAEACAAQLVALQGARGQWWWHYNARAGVVVQPYPVYSVHQYGMAPMALDTLALAGGAAFRHAVSRSRDWLRDNELRVRMVDEDAGTIWRDIEYDDRWPNRLVRHLRAVGGLKSSMDGHPPGRLKVNYETRPYEWAWLLYADALETGSDKGRSLV